ncbi:HET-domain-containing protein [Hyaloscypha variabilis F]|uniref:HET-domain-containing protein n=1 Tax=Hyaloscypha variabilis (strain UAMH 11265 / GT02V1 / F) TaxID=1149755 RepID=A0A2J6R138_HYAVF|nr:HET-domain-containing protein [Hyaloscypha variabilis F]
MDYTTPHSCQHCEGIVLSLPEDNPDLQNALEPRQSRLLLNALRALRGDDPDLKALERAFLLEVNMQDLRKFKLDGCLFYAFILTGLEEFERNLSLFDKAGVMGSRHVISIKLEDDAVEICAPVSVDDDYGRRKRLSLLNDCVFGVFHDRIGLAPEMFDTIASTNIASDRSLTKFREWLADCTSNHTLCKHPDRGFMPTRLIRVWRYHGRRVIQLQESDGTTVSYAALSYCWGGEQEVQTTKQTFRRHTTRINFQDLPKTIKDAVIITENLGLEYLWVDALCIIQDDEKDRAREIDLMGYVYESAELTIVASRAEKVQDGFLQNILPYGLDKPDWVFKMHYRDLQGRTSPMIIAPKFMRTPMDYLSKRAWAFQERLFSYRVLDFGSSCVHWFCQTQQYCDREGGKCTPRDLKKGLEVFRALPDRNANVKIETWYKLVDIISKRSLTNPQDRLPAIGGVAERFTLLSKSKYYAGIWESSLPSGLLWLSDRFAINHEFQQRPSTFLAPSWSWATISQAVNNRVYTGDGLSKVEVINVEMGYPTAGNTYGLVKHGYLTLRGYLTTVDWRLPSTERYGSGIIKKVDNPSYKLSMVIMQDANDRSLLEEGKNSIRASLLVLVANDRATRVTGLILYKHLDGMYSRLGVFDCPTCPADEETYPNMASGFLQGTPDIVTIK